MDCLLFKLTTEASVAYPLQRELSLVSEIDYVNCMFCLFCFLFPICKYLTSEVP